MRIVTVLQDIEGPVFTDAYVGVCCTRMQKRIVWYKDRISATKGLFILSLDQYKYYPTGVNDLSDEA